MKNPLQHKTILGALIVAAAATSSLAYALPSMFWAAGATQVRAPAHESEASVDALKTALEKAYPQTAFKSIEATPIPGLYQTTMGREVAYVSEDGRYFLFNAHLVDMKTQTDLTRPALERAQSIDFKSLPLPDAIKEVKGKGRRVVAVFTDPDCPYCRQLESVLERLDDVTIYRFLNPIEGLHKGATAKSNAIWCAGQTDAARLAALKAAMQKGAKPAESSCETPVAATLDLSKKFGINGTPTLIASDGRVLPGFLPEDRLNTWLDQVEVAR